MKLTHSCLIILTALSCNARAWNADSQTMHKAAMIASGGVAAGLATGFLLHLRSLGVASKATDDQHLAALLAALQVQTPEEAVAKIEEQKNELEAGRQKLLEANQQLQDVREFLEMCNGAQDIKEAHAYIEDEVCILRDNTLSILETLKTYFPDSRIANAVDAISASEGELLFDRKAVDDLTLQIASALCEYTALASSSIQAIEACIVHHKAKSSTTK